MADIGWLSEQKISLFSTNLFSNLLTFFIIKNRSGFEFLNCL